MTLRAAFASVLLLLGGVVFPQQKRPDPVDFARDVEPILRASCVKCHGPEKPKAQLRLDSKPHALKGGVGGPAILPGKGAESPLVKLLLSADPEERMPRKAEPLPREKIDLLRRWIDEGAAWPDAGAARLEKHWAYVKPARPRTPPAKDAPTPIDAFIRARLEKEGVAPSPEAPREKLLRRLWIDLIGLPPSPREIDDARDEPLEKIVDRLLDSPHYGERWARTWLDLARYADTNGFNFDSPRSMWRYRDWVIDALNRDLPFSDFTVEQLAGDLLPGATLEQKVATGFHRNTMINEEGGVDREEARWETLLDRVHTTATVWLGTTLACAQCHNHKFDPFTQREFYRLLAFFDHQDEVTLDFLPPEQEARRKDLKGEVSRLNAVVKNDRTDPVTMKDAKDRLARCTKELKEIEGVSTTYVLREKQTKEVPSTRLRVRGSFENVGEKVSAGVPASLHAWPEGAPLNRLGLARWLVGDENPLVARVAANRLWDQLMGRPLVESPEDFGTQGQPPLHRELLDWLAVEFMENGWSQKKLLRTIVLSATYRQSSRLTPALLEKDPYNRLHARGPRHRLDAEPIRDVALTASGLLSRKIGGPSVYPVQADMSGVTPINKVSTQWTPSAGEDRYRRGLYTYWRRTAPFAAFATFDAPSRECCTVKRQRTNTPLQALSGLNDPGFFDLARGLARRAIAEGGADDRSRIAYAFRCCTARTPVKDEIDLLEKELGREREHYRNGKGKGDAELSAWAIVANILLNLDETMSQE